jgi:hypothetical protein
MQDDNAVPDGFNAVRAVLNGEAYPTRTSDILKEARATPACASIDEANLAAGCALVAALESAIWPNSPRAVQ